METGSLGEGGVVSGEEEEEMVISGESGDTASEDFCFLFPSFLPSSTFYLTPFEYFPL